MNRFTSRLSRGVGIMTGVAVAIVGVVAIASAASGDAIHGCYKTANGQLRIVGATETCLPSETTIQWNMTGPSGSQGATGPKGDTGLTGATGSPGAQGSIGAIGPKGDTGLSGASGAVGPVGATGAAGTNGLPGPQGAQGPQGIPGPQGPAGPSSLPPEREAAPFFPYGEDSNTFAIRLGRFGSFQGPLADGAFDVGFSMSVSRRSDGSLAWSTAISFAFDAGSPELHARASNGVPLTVGSQPFKLQFLKSPQLSQPKLLFTIELRDVAITRAVAGAERCSGTSCPVPVDTFYVSFSRIDFRHGSDGVSWDLATQTATPSSVSSSDLNDAFNFALGGGDASLEHATAFAGPTQTPQGLLANASVNPIESGVSDATLDRRPVRFLSFLKDIPIPTARAQVLRNVANGTSTLLRAYDMTAVRFSSIDYVGFEEKLSFAAESMHWTAGTQTAGYP